jgi:hypothetical protein
MYAPVKVCRGFVALVAESFALTVTVTAVPTSAFRLLYVELAAVELYRSTTNDEFSKPPTNVRAVFDIFVDSRASITLVNVADEH